MHSPIKVPRGSALSAKQAGTALRVWRTSEDDAIVHVSADVQVALAYALLDQPCFRGQRSLLGAWTSMQPYAAVYLGAARCHARRTWQALELGAIVSLHRREARECRQHALGSNEEEDFSALQHLCKSLHIQV